MSLEVVPSDDEEVGELMIKRERNVGSAVQSRVSHRNQTPEHRPVALLVGLLAMTRAMERMVRTWYVHRGGYI